MTDPIIEAWRTHCRLAFILLDAIPDEALASSTSHLHRSIGQIWAHVHNHRLDWLESAAPDLAAGLEKVGKEQAGNKARLNQALASSAQAIESLLARSLAAEGHLEGFRGHVVTFFAYLVAHGAYHQGEICLALTQTGWRLPKEVEYGIWEWQVRPEQSGGQKNNARAGAGSA